MLCVCVCVWSWFTNVKERQTDGQMTCNRKTALCTIVHRTVKTNLCVSKTIYADAEVWVSLTAWDWFEMKSAMLFAHSKKCWQKPRSLSRQYHTKILFMLKYIPIHAINNSNSCYSHDYGCKKYYWLTISWTVILVVHCNFWVLVNCWYILFHGISSLKS